MPNQTHETKTFRAEVKAAGDGLNAGEFIAVVSVFDNVDLGGDRIAQGAFDETIKAWQEKGDPLPIIWSHEWDNPNAHVGYADPMNIKATEQGLEIRASLDVDRPFAEQVSHLLKTRRITQFSFGYFAKEFDFTEDPQLGTVRELKKVDIFEAGPTLLGMNPATQLLEAASYAKKTTEEEAAESEDAPTITEDSTEASANVDEVSAKDAEVSVTTTEESGSGDIEGTIDLERYATLLVRTRHEENL